ncbi:MAG: hypothetical protein IPM21_02590 [Acidobacteria bacterium]|nr:hypothetical protein [Acidobacteriota bacterium]
MGDRFKFYNAYRKGYRQCSSDAKEPTLRGFADNACRQITPEGEDMEYTCLALDSVDSGEGDIVLIAQEGWSASTAATGKPGAAIDSAIVGVVDRVDLTA